MVREGCAGGGVVERYEYDVYGKCRIMDASYNSRSTSSYENVYLFTGRRLYMYEGGLLTCFFRVVVCLDLVEL